MIDVNQNKIYCLHEILYNYCYVISVFLIQYMVFCKVSLSFQSVFVNIECFETFSSVKFK
jgi:hypothetical protein